MRIILEVSKEEVNITLVGISIIVPMPNEGYSNTPRTFSDRQQ
jgi:hypothetical protein